jgi:penicillin-binding protein-related factor A (putative recombinase)
MARSSKDQSGRKKGGTKWETDIGKENDRIFAEGRAVTWRSHEAMRIVGTTGDGKGMRAIRIGKSEPDYHGIFFGGRGFSFDAKKRKPKTLTLPKPGEGWHHQIVALSNVTAYGGVGFIYVRHEPDVENPFTQRRFVLPVVDGLVAGHEPGVDPNVNLLRAPLAFEVPKTGTWYSAVVARLEYWNNQPGETR